MESFKMDKWDELVTRVKQGILAQEPDAVLERAFEPGVQHAEVPSEHDL
jgi:hypothetical protein